MKAKILKTVIFCIVIVFSAVTLLPKTYALSNCDTDFLSRNDIIGYNPCAQTSCSAGVGTLTGATPTQLKGETNAEKVWNYFIERGLSPVAAAGALGNIEQESGFNPWIVETGNGNAGFGIIQWSYERRTKLENALKTADITQYTTENSDKGLLFQLNWLWDGEKGGLTWQEPVNAETSVDGDASKAYNVDNTGNGSTLLFHALVEKSGDKQQGKQERIDSAKAFLEQFGGGGSVGDCSVGEGGLTLGQAEALMKWWVANRDATIPAAEYCRGIDKYQCFSFSSFIHHHILGASCVNGGNTGADIIAQGLINQGWQKVTADTLQPFTVTQHYNHTLVILGIHSGKIIIGETDGHSYNDNFTSSQTQGPNAKVYELNKVTDYNGGNYSNYISDVFAAPPSSAEAIQRMTDFLNKNGIGGD